MLLELLITVWWQPQGQEGEIVPSFSKGMTSKYPMICGICCSSKTGKTTTLFKSRIIYDLSVL